MRHARGVQHHRQVVIGVDVGTTATKVVAFGIGAGALQTVVREYPLLHPQTGWHVQDPDVVLQAVTGALGECVGALGDSDVLAVSLSTASHGLVALDDSLRPLTPVITWADMRAREQVSRLRTSGKAEEVYAACGTPVHSMTPLSKLLWFAEHEPALLASARWWADLKALVVARLTGVVGTDLSSASTTGLLDVSRRDWSGDLAALCGVRLGQLPAVLPTTRRLALLPDVADAAGLPRDCPLVIGAADGPLGNLGIGATGRGVVGVSIGTSGAARVVVPKPTLDPKGRLFCYALTDDHWVLGGAISNGGSVLRWVGELLGTQDASGSLPGTDDDLLALAEGVPAGNEGLVMLPYLLPERAPLWDPYLPGAVLGLRARHTRGHLVRAAVEGVALQLALVVDDLLRLTPVTAVRATGGVFRARLWDQVVADALGRPVEVSDPVGGTALGAAALAVHALGLAGDLAAAPGLLAPAVAADGTASSGSRRVVQPDPEGVAAFAEMRASVRPLLASYGAVADLLHEASGVRRG
jgi:gluconokinase